MGILRQYYGVSFGQQPDAPEVHQRSGGAKTSIIEIFEVIESDFSKILAEHPLVESQAEGCYHRVTQENKVTKVSKEQDVKYKEQEIACLKK